MGILTQHVLEITSSFLEVTFGESLPAVCDIARDIDSLDDIFGGGRFYGCGSARRSGVRRRGSRCKLRHLSDLCQRLSRAGWIYTSSFSVGTGSFGVIL